MCSVMRDPQNSSAAVDQHDRSHRDQKVHEDPAGRRYADPASSEQFLNAPKLLPSQNNIVKPALAVINDGGNLM